MTGEVNPIFKAEGETFLAEEERIPSTRFLAHGSKNLPSYRKAKVWSWVSASLAVKYLLKC